MPSSIRAVLGGWRVQHRVIGALMVREVSLRYGRQNVGFIWIFLEPMMLCTGVMILWSITAGGAKHGMSLIEFILTGYMPLTLWRHMTNSMLFLGRRSVFLLYHRAITLLDVMWAKYVLEFVASSAALLVIWGTLYLAGVVAAPVDLGLVIVGWLMMAWMAAAIGMIFVGESEKNEVFEKFVQPAQYLIIPISGTFIMVEWMPVWAQNLLLLNPLVHIYEVFRAGYFGEIVTTHYSYWYFSACTFVLTLLGLSSIRKARLMLTGS